MEGDEGMKGATGVLQDEVGGVSRGIMRIIFNVNESHSESV